MLVKLIQGFATYYDGKKRRQLTHRSGPADVPDETARRWISRGVAVPVDTVAPVEEATEEPPPEGPEPATYEALSVRQLRAECAARGIRAGSSKRQRLIELLEADDAQADDLEPLAPEG